MPVGAEDTNIKIVQLDVVGGIVSNAYLLVCQKSKDSVLVDTPGDASKLLEQLQGTNPRYILITHNHFDHLMAFSEVRSKLQVPVAAHPLDVLPSPPDILLGDGDTISFGDIALQVLHTPGHTPGSLCFYTDKYLISGDTLFPGGPGKTGSPDALKQIIKSITDKLLPLPDDTQVFSGHGDATVLKKEKEEIATFKSRSHDPNLCGDVLWLSS
ncbi:MAG TPA: MBL fold metallo-hydrolase [Dehalococcoidia bacterium]|nr:MBL fold metallo-hydrolase [Dehalococcoidia bacterium]